MLIMAAAAWADPRATVLSPVANMHSKPGADSDVVSQAIYALDVAVVEEREGWTRIKTPDDYPGWVENRHLRKRAPDEPAYAARGKVAVVKSLLSHVYREASVTRHAPLLTVPFETRLEVILEKPEENGRWLAVRLPDDRQAWVQRGDLTFDPPPRSIAQVIELAQRFLGAPYTWGGTSAYGYDCSGFTQMQWRVHPRDGELPSRGPDLAPGRPALEQAVHRGAALEAVTR
jgi:SH3-like domain-containing protein